MVGHALSHDFKVLFLDHPRKLIRDTSKYKPFKAAFGNRTPSLKNLTARFLGVSRLLKKEPISLIFFQVSVQSGEHSSVQDSQAAVRLYTMHRCSPRSEENSNGSLIQDSFRKEWEASLEAKRTVSASNRKVSLSTEEHLIVNGAKISNPKILGEGEKD